MDLNVKKLDVFATAEFGSYSEFLQKQSPEKGDKVFLRDQMALTGTEVSLTSLPTNHSMPFFHSHKQNEELYIVIRGEGTMQLNDQLIELKEGSVVRVDPDAERLIKSGPHSELLYLCIQSKKDSLVQCNRADGIRSEREVVSTK